ncbi:ATP-binding cassette domain-containing protein [Streptosporangium carneum]|uniref:Daunorubicin ABC transporter ATPase n=1 Tax=Streptosporangium carneum TaxID=47481 RepID=A0A9W6MFX5_9ACTN|nr:ATP-binding cassette domain-containing protein [Streptosporangium carneum]GLK12343.1 daunorubicin ABC transporter ATPase [Streptosporangium carneum]
MSAPMIEATEIRMVFGEVKALDGVSLHVPEGEVLALLGHNGAGKTTLINILATLLPPTSGTARVAGFDVVSQAREVRRHIGITGQFVAVDRELSGTDNLVLIARLLGAGRREAKARAEELLEVFELTHTAGRPARTYSGGMRRRLDLASSLVGHPDVIFLDEPTTGLDPTGRLGLWEIVERLVKDGTAVLLTTQYLDEADRLADSVTVLSGGKIVAAGTASELKAGVGQHTVHVTLTDQAHTAAAVASLERAGLLPVADEESDKVSVAVEASTDLARVVRALDDAGATAAEIAFTQPTLDDVYLSLAAGRVS